ncbi:hypothetical protein GGR58DRAFT_500750 [Xylaria digitata]|nr:hypothetical protein GGR58DRAFT_500750 [Xylaria digitata]
MPSSKEKTKDENKDKSKDQSRDQSKWKSEDFEISYSRSDKRSSSADRAVSKYVQKDTRGISSAFVRPTPEEVGGKTWHTSGTNPNAKERLTVEFYDESESVITVKHINRNGRAC